MSGPRITVVGLGPGDPALLTVGTREAISRIANRYLRTSVHPSAEEVPGARSFDQLYQELDNFDSVYSSIVSTLLAEAQRLGEILYAVPGSPAVAERTVELLVARASAAGVGLELVPAMSFVDLAWVRLGVDPMANPVTLVDAHRLADDISGRRGPFLIAQCHSNTVMGEVKLVLSDGLLDPENLPPLTILHHLGLPDEVIIPVAWHQLDRTLDADHLTAVYVPEWPHSVAFEADRLWTLMARLRRECPWNEEQTSASLAPYAVEEAAELVDAVTGLQAQLDADDGSPAASASIAAAVAHYREELGDVLYQVLFHSSVANDEGWFSFDDVFSGLHDKLVRRHPHIFPRDDFDPGIISSSDDVVRNWEKIKAIERGRPDRG